jgi:hypothetical protein
MKRCKNCRFSDQIAPDVFICCWRPPQLEATPEGQQWIRPPMRPMGWCGQFRLAFFKWLKNFAARAT